METNRELREKRGAVPYRYGLGATSHPAPAAIAQLRRHQSVRQSRSSNRLRLVLRLRRLALSVVVNVNWPASLPDTYLAAAAARLVAIVETGQAAYRSFVIRQIGAPPPSVLCPFVAASQQPKALFTVVQAGGTGHLPPAQIDCRFDRARRTIATNGK